MFISYTATAAGLRARHVACLASTLAGRRLTTAAAPKPDTPPTEPTPTDGATETEAAKAAKEKKPKAKAALKEDGDKDKDKDGKSPAPKVVEQETLPEDFRGRPPPPHMRGNDVVLKSVPHMDFGHNFPQKSEESVAKSELITSLKAQIEDLYKQLAEAKNPSPKVAKDKKDEDVMDEPHLEDAIKTLEDDPVAEEDLLEAANAAAADGRSHMERVLDEQFTVALESVSLTPKDVPIEPVTAPRDAKVARLAHSLTRVLFSPGVHVLRDPRTGVWNFSRELGHIPTPEEFAFHRLPQYITASQDPELAEMAQAPGIKFTGSTSTLTAALSQIYFTLSGDKEVDTSQLSQEFAEKKKDFTAGAQLPASLVVKLLPNGRYAVDNNKEHAIDENILSDYGRILEKLLTAEWKDFSRFLNKSPEDAVPESERKEREAYCYSRGKSLLMRSQLDCQDSRLPGNGTFDIKTRACNPIRNDRANYKANSMYDISELHGLNNSYEREYYDLTRSGMLKFSLQARIGQMDGIFVAYHNTVRCFGFQYLPLSEIDKRLFGSTEMATQVFQVSVAILERILEQATALYPNQSINLSLLRHRYRQSADTAKELIAVVQPTEWDPSGPRPSRAIRLSIDHELDGEPWTEKVFQFSSDPEVRKGHNWVVKFKLSVTPDDHEGYAIAHRYLSKQLTAITAMNALYLPEGATVWQMKLQAKKKARAAAAADAAEREAAAEEAEKAAAKDEEDPFNLTGNAITAEDIAEAEAPDVDSPPLAASPTVRWMNPNDRIMELRATAKESGIKYRERTLSWSPSARYAYWWQTEERSEEQGRYVLEKRAAAMAEKAKERQVRREEIKQLKAAARAAGENTAKESPRREKRRVVREVREFRGGAELKGKRKSWSERKALKAAKKKAQKHGESSGEGKAEGTADKGNSGSGSGAGGADSDA